ncbi:divergent PAP2 family protein [Paenibacillus mucilaginosus]|nr:divergent PAP2 family protein [Paenibacillus caseinilyticus]
MNRALWTSIAGIGAAQALKIPMQIHQAGYFDWKELFRTGGMPSSHSAAVVSLATYVGLKKGFASIPFALSTILSLIVMYDAMGIRRHAGLIAEEVNEIGEALVKLSSPALREPGDEPKKELEERLGHLPEEVLGGALLGMAVGWLSYASERRNEPLQQAAELWNGIIRKSLAGLS